mmetsp:Transcript_48956/g.116569  ORF Transcript_48956/g.116569 Transcript_48956/m.116569 type:complete len:546 (-) Transcript_48956:1504-3141(-)
MRLQLFECGGRIGAARVRLAARLVRSFQLLFQCQKFRLCDQKLRLDASHHVGREGVSEVGVCALESPFVDLVLLCESIPLCDESADLIRKAHRTLLLLLRLGDGLEEFPARNEVLYLGQQPPHLHLAGGTLLAEGDVEGLDQLALLHREPERVLLLQDSVLCRAHLCQRLVLDALHPGVELVKLRTQSGRLPDSVDDALFRIQELSEAKVGLLLAHPRLRLSGEKGLARDLVRKLGARPAQLLPPPGGLVPELLSCRGERLHLLLGAGGLVFRGADRSDGRLHFGRRNPVPHLELERVEFGHEHLQPLPRFRRLLLFGVEKIDRLDRLAGRGPFPRPRLRGIGGVDEGRHSHGSLVILGLEVAHRAFRRRRRIPQYLGLGLEARHLLQRPLDLVDQPRALSQGHLLRILLLKRRHPIQRLLCRGVARLEVLEQDRPRLLQVVVLLESLALVELGVEAVGDRTRRLQLPLSLEKFGARDSLGVPFLQALQLFRELVRVRFERLVFRHEAEVALLAGKLGLEAHHLLLQVSRTLHGLRVVRDRDQVL